VCPTINIKERKAILAAIMSERPIPKNKTMYECQNCGEKFEWNGSHNNSNKYCTPKCSHEATEKIKWPDNLVELVAASSKLAVAKQLGVSNKAVTKRLQNHPIKSAVVLLQNYSVVAGK
jgi:DNA-directed RNA polymerase subunit RPC12/RpoP